MNGACIHTTGLANKEMDLEIGLKKYDFVKENKLISRGAKALGDAGVPYANTTSHSTIDIPSIGTKKVAQVVLTEIDQTINGHKTFSDSLKVDKSIESNEMKTNTITPQSGVGITINGTTTVNNLEINGKVSMQLLDIANIECESLATNKITGETINIAPIKSLFINSPSLETNQLSFVNPIPGYIPTPLDFYEYYTHWIQFKYNYLLEAYTTNQLDSMSQLFNSNTPTPVHSWVRIFKYHQTRSSTIKIIDWIWSSPINTLEVIFHSRSDSVEYDDCGRMKIGNDVSPGDQIIWTRVQVGRTLLNCKIASRMIIDNSIIMPSKVTILPDDPLSQQTDKQGFNLLTTFHIPRFSHSVELDPVFNAVILDDDSALPYECIETTDSLPKVIVSVLLSIFLLSITIVAIIVWKVEPPTNRPYREAVEMDPIPNTDQENADQQQQQNN
ncbi:hypothetical protein DFA_03167 [Cavenderia fasciculata]|uniref:Uncharacterized protein n=1 Tax=Cavenderia fasciculata TaxID=261658 RepID=F4PGT8_CACFS|nr:uncharacterized protein DFA_03167 [Cavenderia fasciculata]EGG24922.1 hypothetical protein DFA_03167 [Cavenderia fasciculata]|eukprot:XP_004362773.1 hypothetical protein DFA_03167 [Cavenderia fasciculata]